MAYLAATICSANSVTAGDQPLAPGITPGRLATIFIAALCIACHSVSPIVALMVLLWLYVATRAFKRLISVYDSGVRCCSLQLTKTTTTAMMKTMTNISTSTHSMRLK